MPAARPFAALVCTLAASACAREAPSPPPPSAPVASIAPIAIAPKVAPASDDPECVKDPKAHAASVALPHLEGSHDASELTAPACSSVTDVADVDGDGAPEHDVALCLPPGGHVWDHYLYFSNRGCPRFAGHLAGAELTPGEERHHGVKDLESVGANGCAGNDFTWTRWAWDGRAYRQAERATCQLCTDSWASKPGPTANLHPYCKREIARRKADKRE